MRLHPQLGSNSARGFTLMELMVALAILGLVVVLMSSGLRLTSRISDTIEKRAYRSAEIRHFFRFVRMQLEQAYPYRLYDKEVQTNISFAGKKNSLSLVTDMPPNAPLEGLYWFIIEVSERDGGSRDVVLSYHPFYGDSPGQGDTRDEDNVVLLHDIYDLQFQYLSDSSKADEDWRDDWQGQAGLPGFIRIRVKTRQSGEELDFVVKPRVDVRVLSV